MVVLFDTKSKLIIRRGVLGVRPSRKYIQYRYLVFDPPGLGTRPGYTVLTKPNHSVYPGLVPRPGRLKINYRYCILLKVLLQMFIYYLNGQIIVS